MVIPSFLLILIKQLRFVIFTFTLYILLLLSLFKTNMSFKFYLYNFTFFSIILYILPLLPLFKDKNPPPPAPPP